MRLLSRVSCCWLRISIRAPHEGVRHCQDPFKYSVDISIHAPHEGVRLVSFHYCTLSISISIHAPHEGVRHSDWSFLNAFNISIHAPHEGVRRGRTVVGRPEFTFQSTHPTRGCDSIDIEVLLAVIFQSTHPTRGCDRSRRNVCSRFEFQSTHPTRGCDYPQAEGRPPTWYFNPRTPRGGATGVLDSVAGLDLYFNPRTPRGGATFVPVRDSVQNQNFNPRTPRGGATPDFHLCIDQLHISIHAPHEGVRLVCQPSLIHIWVFQSTHPTRGCDGAMGNIMSDYGFQSTHPTRGCDPLSSRWDGIRTFQSTHPTRGCDTMNLLNRSFTKYFNPRTPRGGATQLERERLELTKFQSTHPTRGCDVNTFYLFGGKDISIHAPHEGVRLYNRLNPLFVFISIHAPHEGVRLGNQILYAADRNFNPRTPRGGATV